MSKIKKTKIAVKRYGKDKGPSYKGKTGSKASTIAVGRFGKNKSK